MTPVNTSISDRTTIAFIGGGNMAGAMIGGLLKNGFNPQRLRVVEPFEATRTALHDKFGITALAAADATLAEAELVIWAVKPQVFQEAALQVRPFLGPSLHLSIAAGIRLHLIEQFLGTARLVRAMPNTPALIGLGMTGLFANPEVTAADRAQVSAVVATMGASVWVDKEHLIDAVTAVSGSGPAYVFYFADAMVTAGIELGLGAEQARQLALATFAGATQLALQSDNSLAELRQQVTSKGGTTHAAITAMETAQVGESIRTAVLAAAQRAAELGA
jgi:pyrroline-5-carboxylate reductase